MAEREGERRERNCKKKYSTVEGGRKHPMRAACVCVCVKERERERERERESKGRSSFLFG